MVAEEKWKETREPTQCATSCDAPPIRARGVQDAAMPKRATHHHTKPR